MNKLIILLFMMILLPACSSLGERTLTTMNDKDKPTWANMEKTMYAKGGMIYAVGFSESSVDSRVSALNRVADNNARFEVTRNISDDLAFIFQNIEEGLGNGGELARFYGSEVSKGLIRGIRQESRFWEKVESFDGSGDKAYKLRVYSLISIREADLKKAIREAIDKKKGITPAIKEQIDAHITREIKKLGEV